MSLFSKILNGLYRAWFFMLIGIVTILLAPFLLIFTISEKTYAQFYQVARVWGSAILVGMGLRPRVKWHTRLEQGKPYMLIANHTTMIDIMLMFSVVPVPFVFVGKKELAKLPLFGFFYKRSSILVDRSNAESRRAVYTEADRRFKQGNSVCIFPEGGVPKNPNLLMAPFKSGAFRMAVEHQIPIVPLVFYDNRRRYPYHFEKAHPGPLRVKVLPQIETHTFDPEDHRAKSRLRAEAFTLIKAELEAPDFS